MRIFACTLIAVSACLVPNLAKADLIELNSGIFDQKSSVTAQGRGIVIEADEAFRISSLGIFGDLVQQSFDAQVYDSNEVLLAEASSVVGGTGDGWHDIALSYTFAPNELYVLHWQPTSINANWANSIDLYNNSGFPTTVGPLTLVGAVTGHEDSRPFLTNTLHPNLRINFTAVPEPTSSLLCGLTLAFAAIVRRRRV